MPYSDDRSKPYSDDRLMPLFDSHSTFIAPRIQPVPPPVSDVIPSTFIVPQLINSIPNNKNLLSLMDSGSNLTLINSSALPPGCRPKPIPCQSTQTTAGTFDLSSEVTLENISFPEFGPSLSCERLSAKAFTAPCRYALIVGRDFMKPNKFYIRFSTENMEWFNRKAPMKLNDAMTPVSHYCEDSVITEQVLDSYANSILPSKYDGIESLDAIVAAQHHLNRSQKRKLLKTLQGFHNLFNA